MTPSRLTHERMALYRRVLGEAWDSLPEPLRAMHDLDCERSADGVAVVERSSGLLGRLVASSSAFRGPAPTFRSRSPFAPDTGVSTGNAISPARYSQACRCKGAAVSNSCCGS